VVPFHRTEEVEVANGWRSAEWRPDRGAWAVVPQFCPEDEVGLLRRMDPDSAPPSLATHEPRRWWTLEKRALGTIVRRGGGIGIGGSGSCCWRSLTPATPWPAKNRLSVPVLWRRRFMLGGARLL
jgi:hypothetical protein